MSSASFQLASESRSTRENSLGFDFAYPDRPARDAFIAILERSEYPGLIDYAALLRRVEAAPAGSCIAFDRLCTTYIGLVAKTERDNCPLKLGLNGCRLTLSFRDPETDVVATLILWQKQMLRVEGSPENLLALDLDLSFGANWLGNNNKPVTLTEAVEAQLAGTRSGRAFEGTNNIDTFRSKHNGHG